MSGTALQLLARRRMLPLLAAILHVPAIYVYSLGDSVITEKPRQCAGLQVLSSSPDFGLPASYGCRCRAMFWAAMS